MWAQVKVKRTLAWSTVGQMGFMMVQCGLAAFPAAALHILGHGCYKAWSFLRAGGLPGVAPCRVAVSPARTLALAAARDAGGVARLGPCLRRHRFSTGPTRPANWPWRRSSPCRSGRSGWPCSGP